MIKKYVLYSPTLGLYLGSLNSGVGGGVWSNSPWAPVVRSRKEVDEFFERRETLPPVDLELIEVETNHTSLNRVETKELLAKL